MVATSLTFDNHLKFGQDSCHTSNGRPTFFPRERERESTRSTVRTTPLSRGASNRPRVHRSVATAGDRMKAQLRFSCHLRPDVDRLATPLGIDESLAFTAFDKTIIFGHWLSKTQKLALASRGFPFEKGFYYILVDYFQKSKKNPFPKRRL